jgi:hypothetical protein
MGEDGVIHGAKAGSLVVDCSTISPQVTKEIAAKLAEKNIHMLDAPISGGSEGAAKGTLSIMIGGDADQYQRALPVFQAKRRILGANGGLHARANRLAFQVEHNEISGAIRINLIGREQRGLIRPGTEYEEFCQWLSEEMLALLNPDTGQCIVDAVLHSDMVYKGEHLDRLPDLIVVWNRSAPISADASPAIGELRVAGPGNRTGNHVSGGFYVGSGPGVVPGEQSGPASIMDLAPTIAKLLKTPLPGTDGKPIPALAGTAFASHAGTGSPEQGV